MTDTIKFWAIAKFNDGARQLGPFETRESALATARAVGFKRDVLIGYGAESAWFDLRWYRMG